MIYKHVCSSGKFCSYRCDTGVLDDDFHYTYEGYFCHHDPVEVEVYPNSYCEHYEEKERNFSNFDLTN